MTTNYLQPVRGTKDLHSQSILHFNHIISIAKQQAKLFAFEELQTPIFEFSQIFSQNLGESSDIVNKEVYQFNDRSQHSLTLRPEFTAAVVRALLSNGELLQSLPRRFFSFGPLFRYDRPQKGRQRQFHQINYEFFGCSSIYTDAEAIVLACLLLANFGILSQVTCELNSLGCPLSKKNYEQALFVYFQQFSQQLSFDSQQRLHKNPLRILDSKDEGDILLIKNAPLISDFYSNEAKMRFANLCSLLDSLNITYRINPRLVRGLDYYTSTVFEFVMQHDGAQNTVLAGGRYDNLVEKMGKKSVPAIGFASGVERIMLLSSYQQITSRIIAVCYVATSQQKQAFLLANQLRTNDFEVCLLHDSSLKKQLKYANQQQAKFALILGEEEVNNNNILCKNLITAEQQLISNDKLEQFLSQQLPICQL